MAGAIQTGPRGGKFTMSKSGNRRYVGAMGGGGGKRWSKGRADVKASKAPAASADFGISKRGPSKGYVTKVNPAFNALMGSKEGKKALGQVEKEKQSFRTKVIQGTQKNAVQAMANPRSHVNVETMNRGEMKGILKERARYQKGGKNLDASAARAGTVAKTGRENAAANQFKIGQRGVNKGKITAATPAIAHLMKSRDFQHAASVVQMEKDKADFYRDGEKREAKANDIRRAGKGKKMPPVQSKGTGQGAFGKLRELGTKRGVALEDKKLAPPGKPTGVYADSDLKAKGHSLLKRGGELDQAKKMKPKSDPVAKAFSPKVSEARATAKARLLNVSGGFKGALSASKDALAKLSRKHDR
jgi:hypothetical protein